ncbi:FtsX-like permease family protein [Ruminococcaceae bacterium OttesenSCG-928-I18]|nr:FtsX-like permease family protein [Ruminococcaceae bacterium OttesenSCG-928-I18]
MIKKSLRKNLSREIFSTLNRFIAIFAITALGAGFYTGLKSTGPDMALTADEYYADSRLSDYRLLSTMGFTEGDVEALRQSEDYSAVMPSYGVDALIEGADATEAVRLEGLPLQRGEDDPAYLNRPTLTEGRWPQRADECLADSMGGEKVGDVIRLSEENEKETLDLLHVREFTVVGLVDSPSYIAFTRGNTNIGNGRIELFYLVPETAFDSEYYTEVYLRDARTEGLSSFSEAYSEYTATGLSELERFADLRSALRYDEIFLEGSETLADARRELAEGESDYRRERADAEGELADAQNELQQGEAELADGRREIGENTARLAEGRQELASGEQALAEARALLEQNRQKLEAGQAEFDLMQATLQAGQRQYTEGLAQYENGLAQYESALAQYESGRAQWQAGLDTYHENFAAYEQGLAAIESLSATTAGLEGAEAQMAALLPAVGSDPAAAAQFTALAAGGASGLRGLAAQMEGQGADPAFTAGLHAAADGIDGAVAGGDYALADGLLAGVCGQLRGAIDTQRTELADGKAELDTAKQTLDQTGAELDAAAAELAQTKQTLDAAKAELDQNALTLSEGQAALDEAAATLAEGWQALGAGQAQLASGAAELDAARAQIAEGEAALATARQTLKNAEDELAEGWDEYTEARAKAEREFEKAERELADARIEMEDGERELSELEAPEWYVLDRNDNPGYSGFDSDTHRIDSIALIFPVFFFLVATLICLTTMTRMVEDQRTQIGTFKALGYSKGAIAFKYLFYGIFASVTGAFTGVLIGSWIFPKAIWDAYTMMYIMPPLSTPLHPMHAPVSILACVVCTTLATLGACLGELRSVPAELMRPKAPRPGKRIFMERIKPLWRKMSFNQKVTSRNIFRYKKRFFMTILGVAGCTALLLTGFGLRDSINGIVSAQFGEINQYDIAASLTEASGEGEDSPLNEKLPSLGEGLYVEQSNLNVYYNGKDNTDMTTSLYVAEDPERLDDFIHFYDRLAGQEVPFPQEHGVLITEKLSNRLGAKAGDTIEIARVDESPVEVTVAGVVENYVFNYVYITPSTYAALFGEAPGYNTVLIKLSEAPGERDESEILKSVVETKGVAGAMDVSDLRAQFDDMLEGLNSVIWVIILSAGSLAFVVLYNLTNINITERAREIATLKVLGFYPREVASYIYRESFFLTLIGAALGLVLGIFLHQFVISAAEIDEVMFRRIVLFPSYLYSILFTLLCVVLVDLVMLRRLKKIGMVESLKSAE